MVLLNVLSDACTRCRRTVTVVSCVIFSSFPFSVPGKLVWIEPDARHDGSSRFVEVVGVSRKTNSRREAGEQSTEHRYPFFRNEIRAILRRSTTYYLAVVCFKTAANRWLFSGCGIVGSVTLFPSKCNDSNL